jgi:hypothetical protein
MIKFNTNTTSQIQKFKFQPKVATSAKPALQSAPTSDAVMLSGGTSNDAGIYSPKTLGRLDQIGAQAESFLPSNLNGNLNLLQSTGQGLNSLLTGELNGLGLNPQNAGQAADNASKSDDERNRLGLPDLGGQGFDFGTPAGKNSSDFNGISQAPTEFTPGGVIGSSFGGGVNGLGADDKKPEPAPGETKVVAKDSDEQKSDGSGKVSSNVGTETDKTETKDHQEQTNDADGGSKEVQDVEASDKDTGAAMRERTERTRDANGNVVRDESLRTQSYPERKNGALTNPGSVTTNTSTWTPPTTRPRHQVSNPSPIQERIDTSQFRVRNQGEGLVNPSGFAPAAAPAGMDFGNGFVDPNAVRPTP